MTTSFPEAAAALRALIEDQWDGAPLSWTDEKPSWENAGKAQPTGADGKLAPWIFVEIAPNGGDSSVYGSSGKRAVQDDGQIRASVFTPRGTGTGTAFGIARDFGEMLRTQDVPVSGIRVQTYAPSIDRGGAADEATLWFRVTVTVDFSVFYTA